MKKYSDVLKTNIEMIDNKCYTEDGVVYTIDDLKKLLGKSDIVKYGSHLILREFHGTLL